MAKKKVLLVITKSNWGGAQRYVFDLATNLPKEQFEVVVALGGTGKKNEGVGLLANKLQEAGVRTIFVKSFMRDISIRTRRRQTYWPRASAGRISTPTELVPR